MKAAFQKTFTLALSAAAALLCVACAAGTEPRADAVESRTDAAEMQADDAEKPDDVETFPCEVKFLLDPAKVLKEDGRFTEQFRSWFAFNEEYRPIEVIFLDTEDRAFSSEGWVNRLRWKEEKKKAECTFKKRYSADGEGEDAIVSLLAAAAADGFDLTDGSVSAEYDWGYSKLTLSLDWEESVKPEGHESLEELSPEEAVDFMKKAMPQALADWKEEGWGIKQLEKALSAGPVHVLRADGMWEDLEITAEIWPIGKDPGGTGTAVYIAELSFKAGDLETAARKRMELTRFLDEKGVLLHEDSLKTQKVLDTWL